MFIESLARMSFHPSPHLAQSDNPSGLNYRLQKAQSPVTVVAFIIMPAATHSYTIEALKGQAVMKQLRDTVTEVQNRIGARLFDHAARFHGSVTPHSTLPYLSKMTDILAITKSTRLRNNCSPRKTKFSSNAASLRSNATRYPPSSRTTWQMMPGTRFLAKSVASSYSTRQATA